MTRHEPTMVLTGEHGIPSWPSKALRIQQIALPRALTRQQAKSLQRVASKGGAEYLNPRLRKRTEAA